MVPKTPPQPAFLVQSNTDQIKRSSAESGSNYIADDDTGLKPDETKIGRMAEESEIMQEERPSTVLKKTKNEWKAIAEKIYRSSKKPGYSDSIARSVFEEEKELLSPLVEKCPGFVTILGFILENKFHFRVRHVNKTAKMTDWGDEQCRRVGCSLSIFIRKSKTGAAAVEAWRLNYTQLDVLFKDVTGIEEFMVVFANNLLRDSIYGMVMRVVVGAVLSSSDAVTDIFTISTYYNSEELYEQANVLLAMLLVNILIQLIGVIGQYRRKSWSVKVKEALITVLFLRPAVDAYRISTNQENDELTIDSFSEMMINKCSELAFESIPGCILQLYVLLKNPEKAGRYALASIGIGCLTTGFSSAMIAFNYDTDVRRRKTQSIFYGYIPNEHRVRGKCFALMTFMSALHNLSRSLGCALLAASDTDNLVLMFVGGEIGVYLLLKILRQDFYCWPTLSGIFAVVVSFLTRIGVKIIVDFSGCIHFRHPYDLGGLGYLLSVIWSQVFPFVALQLYSLGDDDRGSMMDWMTLFLTVSLMLWLVLNVIFFRTIDLGYLNTFFGTKTAPQHTCELFLTSKDDDQKFAAVFTTRIEYTKTIHEEMKEWVAENIHQWRMDQPDWFRVEMIPDEFLPKDVFKAEGGIQRMRSRKSLREIVGLAPERTEVAKRKAKIEQLRRAGYNKSGEHTRPKSRGKTASTPTNNPLIKMENEKKTYL